MENNILDQDQVVEEQIQMQYAGFWERVGASLIDFFVMVPVMVLSYINLMNIKSLPLAIGLSFVYIAYKIFMEGTYGATLGKRAMKIKIVTDQNVQINMNHAVIRATFYLINTAVGVIGSVIMFNALGFSDVSKFMEVGTFQNQNGTGFELPTTALLLISVLFVAFDKHKQALHDKLAKCYCVIR